jgi:hypothetical protein
MSGTIVVSRREPVGLADLILGAILRDVLLVIGTAGFVGILAQVSIHLSFTLVPITGQTFGVLLAGTSLGEACRRACRSSDFGSLNASETTRTTCAPFNEGQALRAVADKPDGVNLWRHSHLVQGIELPTGTRGR